MLFLVVGWRIKGREPRFETETSEEVVATLQAGGDGGLDRCGGSWGEMDLVEISFRDEIPKMGCWF